MPSRMIFLFCFKCVAAGIFCSGCTAVTNMDFTCRTGIVLGVVNAVFNIARNTEICFAFVFHCVFILSGH